MSNIKGTQAWDIFLSFFRRNQLCMVQNACITRLLKIAFDLRDIRIVKNSVVYNRFRVGSANHTFVSTLAQSAIRLILNDGFETVCNFRWTWTWAKIGYSVAEHTRKSFLHTTCISGFFPLSPVPLSTSSLCKETIPPKISPPYPSFRPLLPGGHKEMSSILADQ